MNAKKRRSLKNDERAVSPVIGVIMMIAITVVIAAVVAAFAYGIIGGVTKAPNTALVIEDAAIGKANITIIHHGGDTIVNAFKANATGWDSLQVKINGVDVEWPGNVTKPIGNDNANFEAGEQMEVRVKDPPGLESGDTITIVYTPTEDVLQRVKVM